MKYTLILAVVVILIGTFVVYWDNNKPQSTGEVSDDHSVEPFEIYPGDVVKKIEGGEEIILLDVRTPEEYAEVHLENALLLPVQELSQGTLIALGLGENMKDAEIIIYCRSGARSKTAYDIMESLGYTNIKSVAGGMIHWQEDEYPFTETGEYQGKAGVSEEFQDNGPKIVFNRVLHDFGIIPQHGGIVETFFTVKNEGTEILTIGDITTSCSCTSADISSNILLPGEEAELRVQFDPDFHEEPLGIFKRTVFIQTNDPNSPEAEVVIRVDVAEGL